MNNPVSPSDPAARYESVAGPGRKQPQMRRAIGVESAPATVPRQIGTLSK